jgi:hypothetical protein
VNFWGWGDHTVRLVGGPMDGQVRALPGQDLDALLHVVRPLDPDYFERAAKAVAADEAGALAVQGGHYGDSGYLDEDGNPMFFWKGWQRPKLPGAQA